MKKILVLIKPYFRWGIIGGTLFFLVKSLKDHWTQVVGIQIDGAKWLLLAIALIITLLAHVCSGWVWISILQAFKQPIGRLWGLQVYLKTNLAKYLPGNVWHFYGRISALTRAGGSLSVASLSVLLEPMLIAAAALIIALSGWTMGWRSARSDAWILRLQILSLGGVLLGIHPRILNLVMRWLSRFKGNVTDSNTVRLDGYPLLPLMGALGFLGLRGTGFLFTLLALMPINPSQISQVLSAFSFAWLLGLVVPGAPGGIGVFEAAALTLLERDLPAGLLLSALALFRLVSILAEASGAGLAILSEQRWRRE